MGLALDDIKNFLVVSETLNVTRASEVIGITQPALSYSLKRLETEIGSDLIVRLKGGVQLTRSGELFLQKSSNLIRQWEEARNIISSDDKDIIGEFSFGVHPSVAIYTLDKILPILSKQYPRISYRLIHGLSREVTGKVVNFDIDFGIAINPVNHPDLVIKEMGKDEVTIFKTKKSAKRLILDPSLEQSNYVIKKLKKSGYTFDGHIHSDSLEVIAKMCSQNMGFAILPQRVANQYKELIRVPDAPVFKDRLCFIYRKERHQNLISKNIIKIIREITI